MAGQSGGVHILSGRQFALVYAVAIATFFLVNGPVWRHPFDITASIVWSYLVIPVLVAACLLASRQLRPLALLYNTGEAVLVKFGITYVTATVLWMLSGGPPPRAAAAPPPRADAAVAAAPAEGIPLVVENQGRGFGRVEARVGQAIDLRSADGRLHTFRVFDGDGLVILNQAVPPGAPSTLVFSEALRGTVGCAVHPDEARGTLEIR